MLASWKKSYDKPKQHIKRQRHQFADKGPQFSSVQFSRSVMSDSLRTHGLQHTRLPCPSPTPRACSNSCPLSLVMLKVLCISCGFSILARIIPWTLQSMWWQRVEHNWATNMVFPGAMYGYESWTIKKAEHWRTDAFELRCWRRLLSIPLTARRSNPSILKEINSEFHWKNWCWSSNIFVTWCEEPTHWKRPWCWKRLRTGGEGVAEDEMVGWHHWLNGHEFEQTLEGSWGQRSLECCSPWGHTESDTI